MKSIFKTIILNSITIILISSCNMHIRSNIYRKQLFKFKNHKSIVLDSNYIEKQEIISATNELQSEIKNQKTQTKNDSLIEIPQNNIIHSKIVQKKTSKSIAHLEINKTPGVNQKINPNKPKRFNDLPTIFGLLNSSHKVKHVNLWLFIVTFLLIILILLTIFLIIFAGLDPPIWFILDLIIISLLIFFLIKLNKLNKVRTDKNKKRKNGKDIAVITVAVLFVLIMILNAFSS